MGRLGRTTRIILIALLLPLAWGAYELGRYAWGMHHYRAAEAAVAQREFRQAKTHLDCCISVWPADATLRLLAAQTARRMNDDHEALTQLKSCVDRHGPAEAISLEYQLIRVLKGNRQELAALLAVCEADPDGQTTSLKLEACIEGSLNLMLVGALPAMFPDGTPTREFERTRRAVDRWLERHQDTPDQVQGLVWRGRLLSIGNDYPAAVRDLRQALALDPAHFQARWYLAAAIAQEAPEEAAAHLEMLRRDRPDFRQTTLVLAKVRRSLGQHEQARALLDELLNSDRNDLSVLLECGTLALDTQDLEAAEGWLRQAERLAPEHPEVLLALSRTLQLKGQPDEARGYRLRFQQIEAEHKRGQPPVQPPEQQPGQAPAQPTRSADAAAPPGGREP
jgi:tetratricopeptide (TPR) repeat protein